jgi:DNA modification methylase
MDGLPLFGDVPRLQCSRTFSSDILLGDGMDALRSLEAGSVACIVTDPPYGIAYHSNYYKGKNPHAPVAGDWNVQIGAYLATAERALRDGGAIYMFTRFDVFPLWAREVPPSLSLKNTIIWKKDNWSSGDLTGNFGFQYEMLMFITKGRHTIRGKRWSNVWDFPRVPSARLRMPAEKPVGIYERAIEASSDAGDLIVDTFGGSGTAAEAAVRTGRRFLVCDVDRKMVRIARERVGLPPIEGDMPEPTIPACPVFDSIPASPALWGLHPEDVADWHRKDVVSK